MPPLRDGHCARLRPSNWRRARGIEKAGRIRTEIAGQKLQGRHVAAPFYSFGDNMRVSVLSLTEK